MGYPENMSSKEYDSLLTAICAAMDFPEHPDREALYARIRSTMLQHGSVEHFAISLQEVLDPTGKWDEPVINEARRQFLEGLL